MNRPRSRLLVVLAVVAGVFVGVVPAANAAIPTFAWGVAFGAGSTDSVYDVAAGADGHIYVTGQFEGTTDFDPGAGTFELTSAGGADGFVLKLDADGSFVWAAQFGGTGSDYGNGIAVTSVGEVRVTGPFSGTADFDSGVGTENLTSAGVFDGFVLGLDADGIFQWVEQWGDTGSDVGYGIAVDADDTAYVAGSSTDGTENIAAYSIDTDGNWGWQHDIAGAGSEHASAVATRAGAVVFAGDFAGATVDFDPDAVDTNDLVPAARDVFTLKLDTSGDFMWAAKQGGNNNQSLFGVDIDADGSIVTTGYTYGADQDFDPGGGTFELDAEANSDAFVSKLDTDGNLTWAGLFSGPLDEQGTSIALDSAGNVYATGFFVDTVDFDPGAGTADLTSVGGIEAWVVKLDGDGVYDWAGQVGAGGNDRGNAIAVGPNDSVLYGGYFEGTGDVELGAGTTNFVADATDAYLAKLIESCHGSEATMVGTAGDDDLDGTAGADVIVGHGGEDLIDGLGEDDILCGGPGFDELTGGLGEDVLDGGVDDDYARYAYSTDHVEVDLGAGTGFDGQDGLTDTLISIERVSGSEGDDVLTGDAGDNVLDGLGGSDVIEGLEGSDDIDGGAGPDELSGGMGNDEITGGLDADLIMGGRGHDDIDGGEVGDVILGGKGDDQIDGGGGSDDINGKGGDDTIIGGGGHDDILGGSGGDVITGGLGDDTMIGQRGADSLTGDEGADTADGKAGIDTCDAEIELNCEV